MSVIEMIDLVPSDHDTIEVAMLVDGHRMGMLFGSRGDLQRYCEDADPAKAEPIELAILQWHALDPQFGKQAVAGQQMKIASPTLADRVKVETKEASEIEVKP